MDHSKITSFFCKFEATNLKAGFFSGNHLYNSLNLKNKQIVETRTHVMS